MTDDELDALVAAADELGDRVARALADETGRPIEDFHIEPDEYEFPAPDGAGTGKTDR